jgi:hypothetical protein
MDALEAEARVHIALAVLEPICARLVERCPVDARTAVRTLLRAVADGLTGEALDSVDLGYLPPFSTPPPPTPLPSQPLSAPRGASAPCGTFAHSPRSPAQPMRHARRAVTSGGCAAADGDGRQGLLAWQGAARRGRCGRCAKSPRAAQFLVERLGHACRARSRASSRTRAPRARCPLVVFAVAWFLRAIGPGRGTPPRQPQQVKHAPLKNMQSMQGMHIAQAHRRFLSTQSPNSKLSDDVTIP